MDTPALLEEVTEKLQGFLTLLVELRPLLERGVTLYGTKNREEADTEQLYKTAYDLFDIAAYQDALPILLHLIAHNLHDPRFPFAAGMCFQQLQQPFYGALLFSQTLLLNSDDAASAFRLGECLALLEQPEQALEAFEMALELIHANVESYPHLQEPTEARLQALRHT